MSRICFIALFVAFFCNGVTYSNTIQTPALVEEKPPTVARPTANQTVPVVEPTVVPTKTVPETVTVVPHPAEASNNATLKNSTVIAPEIKNATQTVPDTKNATSVPSTPAVTNSTDTKTNATQIVPDANNSTQSNDTKTVVVVPTVDTKNSSLPSGNNSSGVLPHQDNATVPTTSASSSVTPTVPTTTTSKIVNDQTISQPAQGEKFFHGPSFIGGIVLTVGLTAIGFVAFKFYKSFKFGGNYRTL